MATYSNPTVCADDLREAARGLAHATRTIDNPTETYPVLGALTLALASLAQTMHQLGGYHDSPTHTQAEVDGDSHAGRVASYRVSWELHRAAEILHQVTEALARAHEIEATIAYDVRTDPTPVALDDRPTLGSGLSL